MPSPWYESFWIQDAVKVRRSTSAETKVEIVKSVNSRFGVGWTYTPATQSAQKCINQALELRQVLPAAQAVRKVDGKKNNEEAIRALHKYFYPKCGMFYEQEKDVLRIGPDIKFLVRPFGLLHDGNVGTFFWINYRKSDQITQLHRDVIGAAFQSLYFDYPSYRGFNLVLLDLHESDGESRIIDETRVDLTLTFSRQQLSKFLDPVAIAIRELRDEGFEPRKQKQNRPKQIDRRTLFLPGLD